MATDLDRFFTRINPLMVALARTPILHWLVSPSVLLLTVTGRRTGRRYTIPLGYQTVGDRIVILVSKARRKSWWRNYHDARPVELLLRRRERTGTACVVPPASERFAEHFERTLRRMPWLASQFGLDFARGADLTPDQVAHLGRVAAAVEVTLD